VFLVFSFLSIFFLFLALGCRGDGTKSEVI
jgi:hypothetical protein